MLLHNLISCITIYIILVWYIMQKIFFCFAVLYRHNHYIYIYIVCIPIFFRNTSWAFWQSCGTREITPNRSWLKLTESSNHKHNPCVYFFRCTVYWCICWWHNVLNSEWVAKFNGVTIFRPLLNWISWQGSLPLLKHMSWSEVSFPIMSNSNHDISFTLM